MGSVSRLGPVLLLVFLLLFSLIFMPSSKTVTWDALQSESLVTRQSIGGGVPLRILPVGDSITEGYASTDMNGYRLDLRKLLVAAGNPVDFIGSLSDGKHNPDNQHEGYGGYRINHILSSTRKSGVLHQHPNIVLLHAGTNDINKDSSAEPWESATQRLGKLIDAILCKNPTTVLLVAQIVSVPRHPHRHNLFNAAIPFLVASRAAKGYKILTVDFSGVGGDLLRPDDDEEGRSLHPNDEGYGVMARIWFRALRDLPEGWVERPREPACPEEGGLGFAGG